MRDGVGLILCGWLVLAYAGCNSPQFNTPTLRAPGNTAYERQEALQFDPYPDPKTGPDFAGSRPRDFDIPRPAPPLARNQALPVAPVYAAPPMVLSGPPQAYAPGAAPAAAPYASPAPYVAPYAAPAPAPAVLAPPGPIYSQAPSPIATPTPGYDPYANPH